MWIEVIECLAENSMNVTDNVSVPPSNDREFFLFFYLLFPKNLVHQFPDSSTSIVDNNHPSRRSQGNPKTYKNLHTESAQWYRFLIHQFNPQPF